MMTHYEMVVNGKTYTTLKMTPQLKGKVLYLQALCMKELPAGTTKVDIDATPWMGIMISSILMEHAPALMWDFLPPEAKMAIGTKETFFDGLTQDDIGSFFAWAVKTVMGIEDFLEPGSDDKPTPEQSPLSPSGIPSAEATAGQENTPNP